MIEGIVVTLSLLLMLVLTIGSALVPFLQGRYDDAPVQAEKRWPDEQW